MTFRIGDTVRPKPPHTHDHYGRELPSGTVIKQGPFGSGQWVVIEGASPAFLSGYFERMA